MQAISTVGIDLEFMLNDFLATGDLQVLPTDHAVASDLAVCRACGETIRNGLVRCSECHAFTRVEIEAAYREKVGKRQHA